MNKSKCTDPELGVLLHAYELNILSDEDTERFEIHLLECEHCFKQIKDFESEAGLLSSDEEVKKLIQEFSQEEYPQSESFLRKLWRYIWPEVPWIFKPALAYLLIVLMILPVYWVVKKSKESGVRPITQTISLFPSRSADEYILKISVGGDALIDFVFEAAVAGQNYRLTIESKDGKVIFHEDAFNTFDTYGHGRLLLPLPKMKPGYYRLIIANPRAEPPLNRQEYIFRINK